MGYPSSEKNSVDGAQVLKMMGVKLILSLSIKHTYQWTRMRFILIGRERFGSFQQNGCESRGRPMRQDEKKPAEDRQAKTPKNCQEALHFRGASY